MSERARIPWRLVGAGGVLLGLVLACSGATLDENEAGADVWMEGHPDEETEEEADDGFCQYNGSIATDDRADSAWVMVSWHRVDCDEAFGEPDGKTIFRARPSSAMADPVLDLSDHDDVRVLFPERGVLVMAERGSYEHLYLYDPQTLDLLGSARVAADYNGTRTSPSRRWVAVADNDVSPPPVHVIDTADLTMTHVRDEGVFIEAMWLNQRDVLAVITEDLDLPGVELSLWDPLDPLAPALSVRAPEHHFEVDLDYTWIGVDPLDEFVVFPVHHEDRGDELLLLDAVSGSVDVVEDAHGPVGFTPEGDLIVAYRYADVDGDGHGDEGGEVFLLLVDPVTGEEEELPIPFPGYPEYFVDHEGRVVVVAAMAGDEDLVLFDLDTGAMSEVGGPSLGLEEFVSRPGHDELWLVDDRALFRLDLAEASLEHIPLDFPTEHINILPTEDLLVLDEPGDTLLRFWNPEAREVERGVDLDVRTHRTWARPPRLP